MAMVSAKPRNGTPRITPIIDADRVTSIGSRNTRCRSLAVLALSDAAMPVAVKARALTRNRRWWSYAAGRADEEVIWTIVCWTLQSFRTGDSRCATLDRPMSVVEDRPAMTDRDRNVVSA